MSELEKEVELSAGGQDTNGATTGVASGTASGDDAPTDELQMPLPPPAEARPQRVNRAKKLGVAMAALAMVVGLYVANRWIAPVTGRPAAIRGQKHPMAPNFSLKDMNGNKLDLADYKGKVVLLDFWATWCGPCQEEIPGFVELQERYRERGLAVIGVLTQDEASNVPSFYREFRMNYQVALGDDDGKVAGLFDCCFGLPTTFVIGRDGRIYARHEGAAPPSYFQNEVRELLAVNGDAEAKDFKIGRGAETE